MAALILIPAGAFAVTRVVSEIDPNDDGVISHEEARPFDTDSDGLISPDEAKDELTQPDIDMLRQSRGRAEARRHLRAAGRQSTEAARQP